MHASTKFLERLPLRHRLLLAPLLGLVLILLLAGAVIYEAQRQNALVTRIAAQDMTSFGRYTSVFVRLSEEHTEIFNLLRDAQGQDEEALYDRAKRDLDRIRSAIADLERELAAGAPISGGRNSSAERKSLLEHARSYAQAAASAVDLATVDTRLAGKALTVANDRFIAMNRGLTGFLESYRQDIDSEIAQRVERNRRTIAAIVAAGLLLALLLLASSFVFSRRLARSLEAQLRALGGLAESAGARLDEQGGRDEVARLAGAIATFRGVLQRLQEHERALQAAHDQLERRVEERTRELSEANAELRIYGEVVRSTGEAVAITRPDGAIIDVNPAFELATGHGRAEMLGTVLYREAAAPEGEPAPVDLWDRVRREGSWSGELLDRKKSGEVFPWWATINAVSDGRGEPLHMVSVARDVTALKRSEQQLQKLAFYDPLTGLANRALLDDRLRMALSAAARDGATLAVMYIDLDRFKYVNDTLGHPAGDQLLIEIARRLAKPLRASDTIARMGGDEFTILLAEVKAESDAIRVAERIIKAVGKPVRLGDETVFVGASVGISFYPRDGQNADTLRKHADVALYEAKQAGRGQYRTFDAEMVLKANERLLLSVQIDAALQNNEFALYYQPIVDVSTGQRDKIEALIHWRRSDGSLMQPAMFIPHAEEAGLVRRIDLWTLERACGEVAQWRQAFGRAPGLSVKCSPLTLQQPGIAREIERIVGRTGFDPRLLNLVLSETAVVANRNSASAALREIAALGVSISLDDFGTAYSSLGYLSKLPVQSLKIHPSFIVAMLNDADTAALVQTIISLAHALKLKVVAEGVDSEEQASFLRKLCCDEMQGRLMSSPLPLDEMMALLNRPDRQPEQRLEPSAGQARLA